jgi:hypothetical protein
VLSPAVLEMRNRVTSVGIDEIHFVLQNGGLHGWTGFFFLPETIAVAAEITCQLTGVCACGPIRSALRSWFLGLAPQPGRYVGFLGSTCLGSATPPHPRLFRNSATVPAAPASTATSAPSKAARDWTACTAFHQVRYSYPNRGRTARSQSAGARLIPGVPTAPGFDAIY